MNDNSMSKNRHPVDQLAEVRNLIKAYQKKEEALKEEIAVLMGEKNSIGGDEYIAVRYTTHRSGGLDTKAMLSCGIDIEKFRKPQTEVLSIRIERRVVD